MNGLGYHDAALLTGEVVSLMDRIDAAQRSLSDIWHAVEWWRSCDYGPEQVAEVVAKWRAAGPEVPPEKVDIAKRLWELEQAARLLRLQLAGGSP